MSRGRAAAAAAGAAAALAAALSLADRAPAGAPASGTAQAAIAVVSGAAQGAVAAQGASAKQSAEGAPQGGGIKATGGFATVSVSGAGGEGYARASAGVRGFEIFDRLVSAYGLRYGAQAFDGSTTYIGEIDHLVIDGKVIGDVDGPGTYEAPDGVVTVLSEGAGLRVRLTRERAGFPAGSEVVLASVQASAVDAERSASQDAASPAPPQAGGGAGNPARARRARVKARRAAQPKPSVRPAPPVQVKLTAQRFAFPVFSLLAAPGNDFHGRRATGPHQGNDIWAPFGAPVVAVADGVISRVGTTRISGNRLWLRTAGGDEFFYAHLSAFTAAARSGSRVRAGEVIGFVGNTGDAKTTPPHLHFEIHPAGGEAIDPHTFLTAWRAQRDVPPGAWLLRDGLDAAARPGRLVAVRDFLAQ